MLENDTLSVGTYLYGLYMGVPPRELVLEKKVNRNNYNTQSFIVLNFENTN